MTSGPFRVERRYSGPLWSGIYRLAFVTCVVDMLRFSSFHAYEGVSVGVQILWFGPFPTSSCSILGSNGLLRLSVCVRIHSFI